MFSGISQYFGLGNNFYNGIDSAKKIINTTIEEIKDYTLDIFNGTRKLIRNSFKGSRLNLTLNRIIQN